MRKRRIISVLSEKWQPVSLGVLAGMLLIGLFSFQFDTIAPTIATQELSVLGSSAQSTLSNPLFLHQQVLQRLASLAGASDLLSIRISSMISGVVAVIAFFCILKAWFTKRVAIIGSVFFATSSWTLHVSRIGTPDASYLLLTVPVLALVMLHANKYSLRGAVLLLLSGIGLLYVPGLVWLVIPAVVWRRKLLIQTVKNLKPHALGIISLIVVLGLLPLAVAVVQSPSFLLSIGGIPNDLSKIVEAPSTLFNGIGELFILRRSNPLLGIASIPYLSIATSVLIMLGVVQTYANRKLDRSKLLAILTASGLILHSLSLGVVSLTFLWPFLCLYAVNGAVYLLKRWLTVFPRNPIAEKVALSFLFILAISISSYEMTRYFVAWPHSDDHASTFSSTDR